MTIVDVARLREIAEVEFVDIVSEAFIVVESHISDDPEAAIRQFLTFARSKL